jgi:hypothetical protein
VSKLEQGRVAEELQEKGLVMAPDSPEYQNLNSQITVLCQKKHKFTTTLKSIRYASFSCPVCIGEKTKGFEELPQELPQKKGYRIIGIDNATYNMGISVFDSGKLVY